MLDSIVIRNKSRNRAIERETVSIANKFDGGGPFQGLSNGLRLL
jgi:hypothetical protein